jgi:molybdopterin-binding protein
MNTLTATVSKIDTLENLNIVSFDYKGVCLSMMSLGLSNIKVGSEVILSINSSHIAIAKEFKGEISLSNRFECVIEKLTQGEILSSLLLKLDDINLTSIITTNSVKRMNLKENDHIIALVKASDLSIQKVIS